MKKFLLVATLALLSSCGLHRSEVRRINDGDGIMPLFTIENRSDSLLLRRSARAVTQSMVYEQAFVRLQERMLATVQDPENEGVGIAAPQVGVSIRLVAVQRLDKLGEPFEFYINPVITAHSDETVVGREGCLSVPDRAGQVARYQWVTVSYDFPMQSEQQIILETRIETVHGYVARIFQHEIDHINGILYIDKLAVSN